jgi:hypothetical protein
MRGTIRAVRRVTAPSGLGRERGLSRLPIRVRKQEKGDTNESLLVR